MVEDEKLRQQLLVQLMPIAEARYPRLVGNGRRRRDIFAIHNPA